MLTNNIKPFLQSIEWGCRLAGVSTAIIAACTIRTGIPYNFTNLPQQQLQTNRSAKALVYIGSCGLLVAAYRLSRINKKLATYHQIAEEEGLTQFRQSLKSAAIDPLLLPEAKPVNDIIKPIQLKEVLQRGVSIVLMGNSGCGKSSLIKYFCGEIGTIENLTICNPHDDGKDFDKGIPVIYKYDEILTTIQQALNELDKRKEQKRQNKNLPFSVYVFDEWPSIIAYANKQKKGSLIEEAIIRLGSECRKFNMLIFFCSQSGNTKAMGLEGMGDFLENYVCIRLCKVAVKFARRTHKKGERIDIDYVRENRDKLWGAVMTAIANDEPHWLDQENAALAELEADKSVWRNPDVQDTLIPVFYEKLKAGIKKISRQEINDILERADKKQTPHQLDKFMSTYELSSGARNISYCKLGENSPKKHYRGFNLTDDDGKIPPKLLQAFTRFDLKPLIKSVTSQSPNLVTKPETPTTAESSQPVTKTASVAADDVFEVGDKVIDRTKPDERELVVTKVENRIDGQQCWIESDKYSEDKVPAWSLELANQTESQPHPEKPLKPGDKVKVFDKTGEKIGIFLKEMAGDLLVHFGNPKEWFAYRRNMVKLA